MRNQGDANSVQPVILLTGKNGQVGWELQRSLMHLGKLVVCGRDKLDLSDKGSIRNVIQSVKPNIIVNAAAYTAVDKAEEESDLAMKINCIAPGVMAEEAKSLGALLMHYSTDYVFNGEKDSPYTELDVPDPVNVYGNSKWLGEQEIQSSGVDHIILRTSWVYASRGHNFLRSMIKLAADRDELRVVDDQIGSPTSARLIADVSAQVLWYAMSQRKQSEFNSDLYHLTSAGQVSWFGFAERIVEYVQKYLHDVELKVKKITPITTKEYPTPARRPKSSLILTDHLCEHFGVYMPDWEHVLKLCVKEFN